MIVKGRLAYLSTEKKHQGIKFSGMLGWKIKSSIFILIWQSTGKSEISLVWCSWNHRRGFAGGERGVQQFVESGDITFNQQGILLHIISLLGPRSVWCKFPTISHNPIRCHDTCCSSVFAGGSPGFARDQSGSLLSLSSGQLKWQFTPILGF